MRASLARPSQQPMPLKPLSRPEPFVFLLAILAHWVVIGPAFWENTYSDTATDEPRYVFYAESIRAGEGMHLPGVPDQPTAYVMPLTPLYFALLGPGSLVRLRLGQLLLAALTAVVVFHIGQRLVPNGPRPLAGWLAVALLLTNLAWLRMPYFLLTEPLYIFFFTLGVGALVLYPDRIPFLVLGGVALGLAWLTRSALAGPLLLLFPFLWWRGSFAKMVLVGGILGVMVLPWAVRNYSAFDQQLVLTSTQSGNVFAGAYNDVIYENPWFDPWTQPDPIYAAEMPAFENEIEQSNYLSDRAVEWIQANPEKVPKLWAAHIVGFVRPWFGMARNDMEFGYQFLAWLVAVPLIAYGSLYALRVYHQPLIGVLLVILGGFVIGVALFAIPRYRLPFIPLFVLLQMVTIWHMGPRLRRLRGGGDSATR